MGRPKRAAVSEAALAKKQKTNPNQEFGDILAHLETLQDEEESRAYVTAFVKLPSKKLYADYYALIESPISLAEINKKVSKSAYADAKEFVLDFQLMYDNAVKYNDPDSWIVHDAEKLLESVEEQVQSIGSLEEVTVADLRKMCQELLDEVIEHEFSDDGMLSGPFIEDVNPEEYPDYFAVVDEPMSFNTVGKRLKESLFSEDVSLADNLQEFYDLTTLIFTNAQLYNDPSSLIHEDSKKLQQLFEEKYQELRNKVIPDEKSGIKLKIKAPKEPVKLKLNLKAKAAAEPEPPKKKRGRKPKKVVEEERRKAALEAALLKQEGLDMDEDGEHDDSTNKLNATETNIMGKSSKIPPEDEVFIRRVGFTSSQTSTNSIVGSITAQSPPSLTPAQLTKQALFPDVPVYNAASFFDFQFEPLGFSTKAYSVTLPPDCSLLVSFKVALHEFIYNIKKDDLIDGQGVLKGRTEEDFMCALYLNEEEVSGGFEMTEEVDTKDDAVKLLGLGYELKLNYGLNIITFELRLAPSLAKSLKKEAPEAESNDVGGRHTRHQLQQIKLNWEVEKFTVYVVCGST
ncbi:CIC11C00000002666 [Sungouiella intermedia]|uniref:CIC11C00000002666 n=1 Tax=Sungouiella intermedia TaxID=45354 RepID=A0A1L0BQK7_9ASCO|nr:CIC11C00000002666 [[Candida] intermedia]